MTEHITGQQARDLLDGTTPGPWEWRHNDYPEHDEAHDALGNGDKAALRSQDAEQYSSWVSGSEQDRALAAAAPALAETVAWLHDRLAEIEADRDAKADEAERWKTSCREIAAKLADADNAIAQMRRRHTD